MFTVQEYQRMGNCPASERFATLLPSFLYIVESEWRYRNRFMNAAERELFSMAHIALAGLLDMQEAR